MTPELRLRNEEVEEEDEEIEEEEEEEKTGEISTTWTHLVQNVVEEYGDLYRRERRRRRRKKKKKKQRKKRELLCTLLLCVAMHVPPLPEPTASLA